MQVDKIKMGTVVDHIKAGKARRVMGLLDIG
jgi:aspartate carbamoyltransferase regulatory subunit